MWWKTMTRSPGRCWVTSLPTAATTPEVSCPKTRGAECEPVEIFFRSVPHIPQVWTFMISSPGPILGTGMVSRRTSSVPRYIAACIVRGIDWFRSSIAICLAIAITMFKPATVRGSEPTACVCFIRRRLQRIAKLPGCDDAMAGQLLHSAPEPGPKCHVRNKLECLKATTFAYESPNRWHKGVIRIGDYLTGEKPDSVRLRRARDRCSCHVHTLRAVSPCYLR